MFDAAMLIEAFFITWVVGLTPALIARFWWKKAPLSNRLATSIAAISCVIFAFGFMFLRVMAGGEEGISPAWMLVFFVSRAIMMKRRSLPQLAAQLQAIIDDPATSEEQRFLAQGKLEALSARMDDKRPLAPAGPASANHLGGNPAPDAQPNQPPLAPTLSDPTCDQKSPLAAIAARPEQTDDNPSNQSDFAALSAISTFADYQFATMATRVRTDLRKHQATGIYGDDHGLKTLWDEACFENRFGPTAGLEEAWADTFDRFAIQRVTALPHPVAVLLTIAVEHATGDTRDQNGRQRDDQMLAGRLKAELSRLADQDCDPVVID